MDMTTPSVFDLSPSEKLQKVEYAQRMAAKLVIAPEAEQDLADAYNLVGAGAGSTLPTTAEKSFELWPQLCLLMSAEIDLLNDLSQCARASRVLLHPFLEEFLNLPS
jgi:hypothetical protein